MLNDVSADGSVVVGGSGSDSGSESFYWTESGGMIGLGDLPGGSFSGVAHGVSADGTVVVGQSDSGLGGNEAFRWSDSEGMVGLGKLPGGTTSVAVGVSADGSVVVGWTRFDTGDKAFIWDQVHGMRNLKDVLVIGYGLNLSGWDLDKAISISDDGRTIVGTGHNPSGSQEAWIATLPPIEFN